MDRARWTALLSVTLAVACAASAERAPSPPADAPAVAGTPNVQVPPAAGPATPNDAVVFAEVGGVPVTDAQLVAFEDLDVAAVQAGSVTAAQLLGKVEDRVRFELLAQAAAERGMAQDAEVLEAARKTMVRKLLAQEFAAEKLADDVTEGAIAAYYARHEADFLRPEARRYAVLRFANDPWGRAQAEAFARSWHAEADDARCLATALQVPDPAGGRPPRRRRRLHQPHWAEEGFSERPEVARRYGDEVAEAVFAAPPLSYPSGLVQTQRGPVAVRVLARRRRIVRSLAEARGDILEQLVRRRRTERFADYLDALRARRPLVVYDERVRAWLAHPPHPREVPERAPVAPTAALTPGPTRRDTVPSPSEPNAPTSPTGAAP